MYVSCAYDELYPGGAAFPEPHAVREGLVKYDNPGAYGIRYVDKLFASTTYGGAFSPDIFVDDDDATRALWPLYKLHALKGVVGSVIVAIKDARVFGSVIHMTQGGAPTTLYETQRPNDRAAARAAPPALLDAPHRVDFNEPGVDYLFLSSAGSFNYGHFLVDDLPRLKALEVMQAAAVGRRQAVVMVGYGDPIDRVRREAVDRLAPGDVDVIFIDPSRVHLFSQLYYASPVSSHPVAKNPLALDYLTELVARRIPVRPGDESRDRRLFVPRKSMVGRNLVNQAELIELLAKHKFRIVHPEDLSFAEQVRTFRAATSVVGQMGAGMTNTLFAPESATLLYLAPRGWIEPFYWDLALARKQGYRALYGEALTQGAETHASDFRIDAARLAATVAISATEAA